MSGIVVDASVALCWFSREAETAQANRLLRGGARLIAPALLLPEFANAIWKKIRRGEMVAEQADIAIREINRFISEFVDLATLVAPALTLACEIDHPVYDCIYVALARQRGIGLVTLDRALVARAAKAHDRVIHLAAWTEEA